MLPKVKASRTAVAFYVGSRANHVCARCVLEEADLRALVSDVNGCAEQQQQQQRLKHQSGGSLGSGSDCSK